MTRICITGPYPPPACGMSLQLYALEKMLLREGVDVRVLPTNLEPPRPLKFVCNIPGVRTMFRFGQYMASSASLISEVDVINHFVCCGLYFFVHTLPLVFLARLWKKRIILTYHSGTAGAFLSRWWYVVIPIIRLADHLTVPSAFLQRVFSAYGIKATILPNIVETDLFGYKTRDHIRPRLLCTRQLEPIYNLDCILRAFSLIQQSYPSALLGIAGGGSQESKLRELATELELRNVFFLGFIDHERLPELLSDYDIFINASSEDNFPGAVVEAACNGMPIVTTRAGGIPDMIAHTENGLLVDVGDHDALANGVFALLQNEQFALLLADRARKWAETFSWDDTFNQFTALFELGDKSKIESDYGAQETPVIADSSLVTIEEHHLL